MILVVFGGGGGGGGLKYAQQTEHAGLWSSLKVAVIIVVSKHWAQKPSLLPERQREPSLGGLCSSS